jgi:glutamyl-tRNA synthetase
MGQPLDLLPPEIVGRVAPSPTGAQHLGNARTYLLAWLAARVRRGRIILRIEDLDTPRTKPAATQQAIDDLRWLGLDWDEGPDCGGPNHPYVQSARLSSYEAALRNVIERGLCYPCTCSRSEVAAAASAPHETIEGPRYPGTCAGWRLGDPLPDQDYCWRFRSSDRTLVFEDRIAGRQVCSPAKTLGDWVIARRDGNPSYQLAVVVDDLAMGINQVVRGADLIPSTFRQLDLMSALGTTPAIEYWHPPLVVGSDGRRLAKRHGDTRLANYRAAGCPPQRIVGWAAWTAGLIEDWEDCRPEELLPRFEFARIVRAPTVLLPEHEARFQTP